VIVIVIVIAIVDEDGARTVPRPCAARFVLLLMHC
jgi:hypothetical protein